jgi:hypothetical protein
VTGNTLSAPCGLIQGSVVSFGSVPKLNAKAHKKGKDDRQSFKKIILNYDPISVLCVWGGGRAEGILWGEPMTFFLTL